MNILGKILVFLNLLFALVVGGFLLIDFQTRINWKKAYDDLKMEMKVSNQNRTVYNDALKRANVQINTLEQQVAQAKKDLFDLDEKSKDTITTLTKQVESAKPPVAKSSLLVDQSQAQMKNLQQENKNLVVLVDKRDKQVSVLEQEKDKFFKEMTQALNEKDVAVARMQNLQDRLKELELKVATNSVAKLEGGKGPLIKDKNAPNPPPFKVKGIIEKVDAEDKELVLISLGSDQGIQVGHTLDVYRNKPEAKYLGQIRIEEVTARKAVGRLMPSLYSYQITLKANDQVDSQLSSGY